MKLTKFIFTIPFLLQSWLGADIHDILPDPYPEVYELEEILPFNNHGWYGHHETFKKLISDYNITTAIEVGSWLGKSARDIASMLPDNGILYSVDTWQGSEEHQPGASFYIFPIHSLFPQFLSNVVHTNLQHKIIPVRLDSLEAARRFKQEGIKVDFIYIDASHDYESIKNDMNAWYPILNEGGIFCGDDFHHEPIRKAVFEFAAENNLKLIPASCWLFIK